MVAGQTQREVVLQLLFGREAVTQDVPPGADDPEEAVR